MSGGTPGAGPESTAAGEPRPGQRIGSYRLVRLIGQGATGRVFEVQHLTIGRRAAMKILGPEHARRPGSIKRLFAEAQAVSTISHPHIVEVTDLIEADLPDGANAIVMELLEGQSLAQAIAASPRMAPARFLPILAQVAEALAAAHAVRLVHRDLKPENVFLTHQGSQRDHVKLLDFGLVKGVDAWDPSGAPIPAPPVTREVSGPRDGLAWTEPDPGETSGGRAGASKPAALARTTADGVFVGTPAYASPEQAMGKQVDHRTDIYSLGVILYELLCGRLPFEGRNFGEYVVKHLTEPPPPAPPEVRRTRLGRTLDAIARRCLAKDPAERFASAGDLRDLFWRLARGADTIPGLTAGHGRRPRPLGRWAAATLSALAVAVGVGWVAHARVHHHPGLVASAAAGPRIVPLPAPAEVWLSFESQPPGAEVHELDHDVGAVLGLTPLRLPRRADGRTVEYELTLPGYVPLRERVVLAPDGIPSAIGGPLRRVANAQRRRPGRERGAAGRAKRRPSKDATLNPFSP